MRLPHVDIFQRIISARKWQRYFYHIEITDVISRKLFSFKFHIKGADTLFQQKRNLPTHFKVELHGNVKVNGSPATNKDFICLFGGI